MGPSVEIKENQGVQKGYIIGSSVSVPAIVETRGAQRLYDARRAHQRANIAPIPAPANMRRRRAGRRSLKRFLETYFPNAFPRKWSPDHLEVIKKTQDAVLKGGMFAVAMPRGSGKTTIHQRAAIWAINYGLRPYVFIVCADADKAHQALRSIKTEYEFNPLLFADFPEICKPIRELQGTAQAARKQHVDGAPTLIDWTTKRAQLPHVKGSLASGALVGVGGITGAARGAQITLPSGDVLRPSLILVDDFQTRESAASPTQCKTRLDTITGDLCGMRGPGDPMAMLVTATVIYQGDAADQLLNRKRFPEFHGTRKKLVYSWPTNEKLWEKYAELRNSAMRNDLDPIEADNLYKANRKEMDEGAVVAWPERKNDDELSALQHACNLKIADPDAFAAEYQNEPVSKVVSDLRFLTADEISEKITNRPKGEVSAAAEHIVAAIDVQGNSLWWGEIAWSEGFTGYVLDYGVFPPQGRRFFNQRDLPATFATLWPALSEEEAIYKALGEVTSQLLSRRWKLDSGTELGISKLLIDEGYKDTTVHLFCRQAGPASSLLVPAKGWGIAAGKNDMDDWPAVPGETVGAKWRLRPAKNDRTLRHVLWDANSYKTLIQERLVTQQGGRGCLSLCGESAMDHRLLSAHLTAEYPVRTEGRGRVVTEWHEKPTKPDNHWFDVLAMCGVAGSMCGVELVEGELRKQKRTVTKSLSEWAAEARK